MDIISDERLKRAKAVSVYNAQIKLPEFALPAATVALNTQFIFGKLTFLEKAMLLAELYGASIAEQLAREESCIQANASIALEGFSLDPIEVLLNERYISGEIELDEKLQLIKQHHGIA